MVVKSKSSTPSVVPQDHPANELSILTQDQIIALSKLQPVHLPNESTYIENDLEHPIHSLRTSWKYIYVVNWIYHCRGFVRLQSEYFDIDLLETELLGLVSPPPLDESILFINKLRVALISTVQGSKCSPNNFENIFRIWFGSKTPLGGRDDDEEEEDVPVGTVGEGTEVKNEPVVANGGQQEVYEPRFEQISLQDKFEVLYLMIEYISGYPQFRAWIDKNNVPSDMLRWNLLFHENTSAATSEDYLLLFDCTRLYKRITKYPQLSIPKKRKLAPKDPETHFNDSKFDVVDFKFELITKGIYQYNKYIEELKIKSKRNSKFKTQYSTLTTIAILETLYIAEIKKRKFITSRKKDLQLANLLATRKRSSRLEAKEKQKQEELRLARIQEEEELRIAAEKRLERRRLARNEQHISEGMTREERLRMRRNPEEEAPVENAGAHDQLTEFNAVKPESDGEVTDLVSNQVVDEVKSTEEEVVQSTPVVEGTAIAPGQEEQTPIAAVNSTEEDLIKSAPVLVEGTVIVPDSQEQTSIVAPAVSEIVEPVSQPTAEPSVELVQKPTSNPIGESEEIPITEPVIISAITADKVPREEGEAR
ncbi:hypothetical protein CLIB1423_16S01992 [[Candida] railenensis]|uniref:Uncharacterized protein n=1 Tax=[Candida] railenensis TaxID=45579 RepID=A0A9P0W0C3_9ASCO|nr:hypothetical protein CLIB1423_16S01992 [[Candida] railenensis]